MNTVGEFSVLAYSATSCKDTPETRTLFSTGHISCIMYIAKPLLYG